MAEEGLEQISPAEEVELREEDHAAKTGEDRVDPESMPVSSEAASSPPAAAANAAAASTGNAGESSPSLTPFASPSVSKTKFTSRNLNAAMKPSSGPREKTVTKFSESGMVGGRLVVLASTKSESSVKASDSEGPVSESDRSPQEQEDAAAAAPAAVPSWGSRVKSREEEDRPAPRLSWGAMMGSKAPPAPPSHARDVRARDPNVYPALPNGNDATPPPPPAASEMQVNRQRDPYRHPALDADRERNGSLGADPYANPALNPRIRSLGSPGDGPSPASTAPSGSTAGPSERGIGMGAGYRGGRERDAGIHYRDRDVPPTHAEESRWGRLGSDRQGDSYRNMDDRSGHGHQGGGARDWHGREQFGGGGRHQGFRDHHHQYGVRDSDFGGGRDMGGPPPRNIAYGGGFRDRDEHSGGGGGGRFPGGPQPDMRRRFEGGGASAYGQVSRERGDMGMADRGYGRASPRQVPSPSPRLAGDPYSGAPPRASSSDPCGGAAPRSSGDSYGGVAPRTSSNPYGGAPTRSSGDPYGGAPPRVSSDSYGGTPPRTSSDPYGGAPQRRVGDHQPTIRGDPYAGAPPAKLQQSSPAGSSASQGPPAQQQRWRSSPSGGSVGSGGRGADPYASPRLRASSGVGVSAMERLSLSGDEPLPSDHYHSGRADQRPGMEGERNATRSLLGSSDRPLQQQVHQQHQQYSQQHSLHPQHQQPQQLVPNSRQLYDPKTDQMIDARAGQEVGRPVSGSGGSGNFPLTPLGRPHHSQSPTMRPIPHNSPRTMPNGAPPHSLEILQRTPNGQPSQASRPAPAAIMKRETPVAPSSNVKSSSPLKRVADPPLGEKNSRAPQAPAVPAWGSGLSQPDRSQGRSPPQQVHGAKDAGRRGKSEGAAQNAAPVKEDVGRQAQIPSQHAPVDTLDKRVLAEHRDARTKERASRKPRAKGLLFVYNARGVIVCADGMQHKWTQDKNVVEELGLKNMPTTSSLPASFTTEPAAAEPAAEVRSGRAAGASKSAKSKSPPPERATNGSSQPKKRSTRGGKAGGGRSKASEADVAPAEVQPARASTAPKQKRREKEKGVKKEAALRNASSTSAEQREQQQQPQKNSESGQTSAKPRAEFSATTAAPKSKSRPRGRGGKGKGGGSAGKAGASSSTMTPGTHASTPAPGS
jgi:hypothetical protein